MKTKEIELPRFKSESEEADWWASREGRGFLKRQAEENKAKGVKVRASGALAKMQKKASIQIAIRLPQADIDQARAIATRRGIGYQTLLKMIVHEGLAREAQRR